MNINAPTKNAPAIGQNRIDGTMFAMLFMAADLREKPKAAKQTSL